MLRRVMIVAFHSCRELPDQSSTHSEPFWNDSGHSSIVEGEITATVLRLPRPEASRDRCELTSQSAEFLLISPCTEQSRCEAPAHRPDTPDCTWAEIGWTTSAGLPTSHSAVLSPVKREGKFSLQMFSFRNQDNFSLPNPPPGEHNRLSRTLRPNHSDLIFQNHSYQSQVKSRLINQQSTPATKSQCVQKKMLLFCSNL